LRFFGKGKLEKKRKGLLQNDEKIINRVLTCSDVCTSVRLHAGQTA
jgi:hypothetical protein